jgi:beta-lactamase class A
MSRIRVRAMLCGVVTCGAVLAAVVPAAASAAPGRSGAITSTRPALCTSAKRPKFAAWLSRGLQRAIHGRNSSVGLAVADPRLDLTCALHATWHFDAASTIKASIISALLLKEHGPSHLSKAQRNLAWLMITQSDNDAATDLWNEVGMTDMQRFLNKAGMKHTELNEAWGLTEETAQDELTLLRLLATPGKVLSTASRQYVLSLMAHVIPSQRWGVPAGAPRGVTVSVKNGWLPYPGANDWHVNSLGVFRGHEVSYQIAVLTSGDSTWDYGIDTIEAAARVINRDIAKG